MSLPRVITGTPGVEIGVVCTPIGRKASVLTASGAVVDGYVPPEGYPLADSEVLHRGPEVRARSVNADGTVIVDADGTWQKGPKSGGGWMHVETEAGARIEIRYIEADERLAREAA
jgi:hypothetical protein